MVPKRECPALESTSAGTELERLGQLHLEMQQTAVDDFLLADGTRSSDQRGSFYFQEASGIIPEKTISQVTDP